MKRQKTQGQDVDGDGILALCLNAHHGFTNSLPCATRAIYFAKKLKGDVAAKVQFSSFYCIRRLL